MPRQAAHVSIPSRALHGSAAIWFVAAAAGQLMFAVYLASLYGAGALYGDADVLSTVMRNGRIEGDPAGNAALMAHVLLAFVITLGGLLQLTPQVREAAPAFHRWNGRVYLTLAVIIALTGLVLTWARPTASGLTNQFSITLNGVA